MAKNKWDINNIVNQQGKVVIVTGSSSGIGLETALEKPLLQFVKAEDR